MAEKLRSRRSAMDNSDYKTTKHCDSDASSGPWQVGPFISSGLIFGIWDPRERTKRDEVCSRV